MQVKWFKDCKTQEDKDKRKNILLGNKESLDILSKICYNIVLDEQKSSQADYDSTSWSHKQAHKNGRIEALQDIIKMCDLTTKDH